MNLPIEKNKRIIVLGDIMLDQFHHGQLEDTSKEDPLAPILKVKHSSENLGGAGNVAVNIKTMESTPYLIGVIGDDHVGAQIEELCAKEGLTSEYIVRDDNRCTTLKTRLYDKSQVIRYDREVTEYISTEIEKQIIAHFEELISNSNIDGIILQDYNKGVLSKSLISIVIKKANNYSIPVFVDPKKNNFFDYEGVTLFKPNLREINWAMPALAFEDAAEMILNRIGCELAAITLSQDGIYIKSMMDHKLSPSLVNKVVDVCGAGDTVIVILALTYLSNCNMNEISYLANLAAANVCQQSGVIPIEYRILANLYASHYQDK